MIENATGKGVKTLHTDNGGEYTAKDFEQYLNVNGILHQLTVRKTPEQNGVAERFNRTIVEMVRAMLSDSGWQRSSGQKHCQQIVISEIEAQLLL